MAWNCPFKKDKLENVRPCGYRDLLWEAVTLLLTNTDKKPAGLPPDVSWQRLHDWLLSN
jgi:hypothetical protein